MIIMQICCAHDVTSWTYEVDYAVTVLSSYKTKYHDAKRALCFRGFSEVCRALTSIHTIPAYPVINTGVGYFGS